MLNYSCRKYKVCPHEDLTFEGAVKLPLRYLEILTVGDNFPLFTQGCTNECKEKMIKITQYVYKYQSNALCWFFNDAKLIKDKSITPGSYLDALSGRGNKKDFEHGFDLSIELNEDGSLPDYPNTLDDGSLPNNYIDKIQLEERPMADGLFQMQSFLHPDIDDNIQQNHKSGSERSTSICSISSPLQTLPIYSIGQEHSLTDKMIILHANYLFEFFLINYYYLAETFNSNSKEKKSYTRSLDILKNRLPEIYTNFKKIYHIGSEYSKKLHPYFERILELVSNEIYGTIGTHTNHQSSETFKPESTGIFGFFKNQSEVRYQWDGEFKPSVDYFDLSSFLSNHLSGCSLGIFSEMPDPPKDDCRVPCCN
ncbi:hypothetical protein ACTFIR_010126 [Dictyostelium discoideum]